MGSIAHARECKKPHSHRCLFFLFSKGKITGPAFTTKITTKASYVRFKLSSINLWTVSQLFPLHVSSLYNTKSRWSRFHVTSGLHVPKWPAIKTRKCCSEKILTRVCLRRTWLRSLSVCEDKAKASSI